jgi:hypothetical protein
MGYSSQLGFELGIGYGLCEGVAQNLETTGRNLRGRRNRLEFGLARGTLSAPLFCVPNGRHLLDDLLEHDIDALRTHSHGIFLVIAG